MDPFGAFSISGENQPWLTASPSTQWGCTELGTSVTQLLFSCYQARTIHSAFLTHPTEVNQTYEASSPQRLMLCWEGSVPRTFFAKIPQVLQSFLTRINTGTSCLEAAQKAGPQLEVQLLIFYFLFFFCIRRLLKVLLKQKEGRWGQKYY